jgi:hypothetical protein
MIKRQVFFIGIVVAAGFLQIGSATAQSASERSSAAKELMVAMRTADQFKAIMPTIFQALKPAIVQGRAEVERDYDAIQRPLLDAFLGRMNDLIDAVALVYARHFSEPEMRALAEFMRGPVGQKFVEKNPVVFQETMLVGQKFGQQIAGELREKIAEELRKRGHKI